jgi:hypothetical protein
MRFGSDVPEGSRTRSRGTAGVFEGLQKVVQFTFQHSTDGVCPTLIEAMAVGTSTVVQDAVGEVAQGAAAVSYQHPVQSERHP